MRASGIRAAAVAVGLALLGGTALAGTAEAATLKASYLFQGTRASQTPGAPDLVDLGPGNRFRTETLDGVPRQVLTFPRGGGLSLATTGLVDPVSHSIVMNVRMDDIVGYRRLLDFSGGNADAGLYNLDGQLVLYGAGGFGGDSELAFDGSWVQVALTSEATLTGSQWTVTAINGTPVSGTTTSRLFRLRPHGLRLFKDNVRGPARREESAGAVACVLVYDGALTTAELRQVAADPLCPAPRRASAAELGFTPGTYVGRTSQGLPIGLIVTAASVQYVTFRWRARCADGRVHANWIGFQSAPIRDRRFSASDSVEGGGRARVIGRIRGNRASGRLARWGGSAFRTRCIARGIRWHARLTRAAASGTS